jgi:hypothetical protein
MLLRSWVNMPVPVRANGHLPLSMRVTVRVPMHPTLVSGHQVPAPVSQCHQQSVATQDCPAEDRRWGNAQHETAVRNGTFVILLRPSEQSQR